MTEPAPPAEPSAAPAAPPAVEVPAQVLESFAALKSELAELKNALTPKPTAPTEPPASWFDVLRQGEISKAEELLAEKMRASVGPSTKQEAVQEALELFRAETEISDYLKTLRSQNPELTPMERYLKAPVEARVREAQAKGLVKSAQDFVNVYKAAVDAEVGELRKLSQHFRAAGKQEAITTRQQVISASTVEPNAVNPDRGAPPTTKVEEETPADYLSARKNWMNRMRRMTLPAGT